MVKFSRVVGRAWLRRAEDRDGEARHDLPPLSADTQRLGALYMCLLVLFVMFRARTDTRH